MPVMLDASPSPWVTQFAILSPRVVARTATGSDPAPARCLWTARSAASSSMRIGQIGRGLLNSSAVHSWPSE